MDFDGLLARTMDIKIVTVSLTFLSLLVVVNGSPAILEADSLPRARNVSWSSNNFKTILTWGPKPVNYTYTVEFSRLQRNRQRNPHCIQSTETECDLTNELVDLKGCYSALVLSEPLPGKSSDMVEFPFGKSKLFCPYNDTLIGRPDIKLMLREDQSIKLRIRDPITALQKDGRSLNIRDVFKKHLKYKIVFNKAGSTGQKTKIVDESEVEFNGLDKDQSYCFSVAAYIPSRKIEKSLGQWSLPKCSPHQHGSILEEYGLPVIGGAVAISLALLIAVIVPIVVCCKRKQRPSPTTKETTV